MLVAAFALGLTVAIPQTSFAPVSEVHLAAQRGAGGGQPRGIKDQERLRDPGASITDPSRDRMKTDQQDRDRVRDPSRDQRGTQTPERDRDRDQIKDPTRQTPPPSI